MLFDSRFVGFSFPMPLIQWSPALEVGVEEIDHQHKVLVAILNRLHDAINEGQAESQLNWILKELEHYTDYHFATEEALMKAHKYEFAEFHKADHLSMILRIRDFLNDLDHHFVSPQMVLDFLQHWLLSHIAGADRHLGEVICATVATPPLQQGEAFPA